MNEFEQFLLIFSRSEKKLQQLRNHVFDSLNIKSSAITYIILLKNNFDGLQANQLCKYSGYDKALISRITNELIEKGYICRNPKDNHKQRGYRLILTTEGWELSQKVELLMKPLQEAFEKDIPPEDLEKFYQTIMIMAKNMNDLELNERRLNNDQ
ncbi:MAG: MarR family winged helix-turn-helix transcriptional regulator [Erysipelotrichaceae bacterium]|nr:MarR family winged helix-turn-helix transcriptional regulator [Erysipelotrichaceae bacterium]